MYKQLTSEQRYTISVLLQKGETKSAIAKAIGVHPSTITRELRRNTGSRGKYVWETAQRNAVYHKHRQPGNRAVGKELRQEVESLLRKEQWSPEQISGYLKLQGKHISHETIYKMIRKDKRQGGDLYKKESASGTLRWTRSSVKGTMAPFSPSWRGTRTCSS